MTMEGTPFNTSAVKRTMLPHLFLPYSARKTPEPIPSGTPIRLATASNSMEPTIALAMPPPVSPIGLGIWVRKSQFSAPMPRVITVPRIRKRGIVTMKVARQMEPSASQFVTRLRTEMFCEDLSKSPRRHSPGNRPDKQTGERINDQGYYE